MAIYKLTGFAEICHALVITPAGGDGPGRERWRYELFAGGSLIFDADDLSSPGGASEDEVAHSALTFLTLRLGDVEAEYFDGYSDIQCEWRDMYAEELSLALYDDESRETLRRYRLDDADAETQAGLLSCVHHSAA